MPKFVEFDSNPSIKRIRLQARIAEIITLGGLAVVIWLLLDVSIMVLWDIEKTHEILNLYHDMLLSNPEFEEIRALELYDFPTPETYSLVTRIITLISSISFSFLGIYALCWARQLFRGYGRGEIFTQVAAKRLGLVGWSVVLMVPVTMIAEFWEMKAIMFAGYPLSKLLEFSQFDVELLEIIGVTELDVFAIIIGLVIVLVSRILGEASKLSEEVNSFV